MKKSIFSVLVVFFLSLGGCAKPLPVLGGLPEFSFRNQSGQIVTRDDLKEKVWVADFIYTVCPDVCPLLTQKMGSLLQDREWKADPRVVMVSLTVDPEVDTVERLSHYAASFEADPTRWFFLTGDAAGIQKAIVEGFEMPVQKISAVEWMHGERFVLVDKQSRIRGYFEVNEDGLKNLRRGIRQLLKE